MKNKSLINDKLSIEISKLKTSLEAIAYSQAVVKKPLVGREQLLVNYSLESFSDDIGVQAQTPEQLIQTGTEKFKQILSVYLANLYSVNEKHAEINKWLTYLDSKVSLTELDKDKLPVLSYFRPNSNYVHLLCKEGLNIDKVFSDLKILVDNRDKITKIFSTLVGYIHFEISSRTKDKIVSKAKLTDYNGFNVNINNLPGLQDLSSTTLTISSDSFEETLNQISQFSIYENANSSYLKTRNELFTQSELSMKDWMSVYKRLRNEDDITSMRVISQDEIKVITDKVKQSIEQYWNEEHDSVFHSSIFIDTLQYFVNLNEFTNKDKQLVDLLIKSLDFYNKNTVVLDQIGGSIIESLISYLETQISAYNYVE